MTAAKIEKFARMADQIGDYFAAQPAEEAAMGVASHIKKFWTPKMIAETLAGIEAGNIKLNETTRLGFVILAQEAATAS